MISSIRVLARAQLRITLNTFWRGKLTHKIGIMFLLGLGVFGAWLLHAFMGGAVRLITNPRFLDALERASRDMPEAGIPTDIRPFLVALPGMALFATLVMLLFTSFGAILSSLYLSGDMDLLLVAPVPMRAVFVVKIFSALTIPYLVLVVLVGPVLAGYGQGMAYGPAFFVTSVLVLLIYPLLPAGISALLVMAVVRVVPARRAREIVGILGGLLGGLWYVLSQFSLQLAPQFATVQTINTLRRVDLPLLPSSWAAHALIAAGENDWLALLGYGSLFAGVSLVVFAGCVQVAERLYYAGWSNMADQNTQARRQPAAPLLAPGRNLAGRVLSAPSAAILTKDLRIFPRDLNNVQQLIFPLAISGIWIFQLLNGGNTSSGPGGDLDRAFGRLGPAIISLFVCVSLSSALAGPGISREGRALWMLQVAPISAWQVLLGKLALAYLPFLVVGVGFTALFGFLRGSSLIDQLAALALVLCIGMGASSITLGFGAAYPRLDWTNPYQQVSFRTGCIAPILYLTYIALALGISIGLPAFGTYVVPTYTILFTIIGWLGLLILTAAVSWGALAFGAHRLERLEL